MSTDTVILEVRAAEGGEDSRLLVREQISIYSRFCVRQKLLLEVLDDHPNMVTLSVTGRGACAAFKHEGGGHRFQRVPPTEKRGRVQSSTITVAVLPVPSETEVHIAPNDLDWKTCRGSGPGGQHRNKTDSAVQLTHLPTGLVVFCQNERSQHQNKQSALDVLRGRLAAAAREKVDSSRNQHRQSQVGSGMRGDKVRTIALQRDEVVDHVTGRSMRAKAYLRGEIEGLW